MIAEDDVYVLAYFKMGVIDFNQLMQFRQYIV